MKPILISLRLVRACFSGLSGYCALTIFVGVSAVLVSGQSAAGQAIQRTQQSGMSAAANSIATSSWSPPSPDPAGIVYWQAQNRLLISDSEVSEIPALFTGDNVFASSLSGGLVQTYSTSTFSLEPTGVAINPANQHLFYSDDDARRVFEVDPGPDGVFHSADDQVSSFSTYAFGSKDPEGVAFDSWRGHLIIADGRNAQIYDVDPGPNGVFDGVSPNGDDLITSFDTAVLGLSDPEGVAFDDENNRLYIISQAEDFVVEATMTGALIRTIDLGYLALVTPADLTLAPSSANSTQRSLYIVDRRVDNNQDPNENDGMIYEISLEDATPAVPQVSISDVTVSEGAGQAQFTVTLSSASSESIVVDYSTRDGSAVAGTDYVAASGQVVLAPGSLSGAIGIDLVDDGQEEGTESFAVDLQSSAQVADGEGVATITDDDTISPPDAVTISVRVASGTDDAEETQSGQMNLTSSDLDMTTDLRGNGGSNQTVGLRFRQVSIPAGATILSAAIQFQADEAGSSPASLLFRGEAIDDAPGFTSGSQNITSRATTNASVSWQADPWPSVGASGSAQLSADLSPVIQEIVDRPGWQDGRALVIIISGSGDRIAEAYEGSRSAAPELTVIYQDGSQPVVPQISISDVTVSEGAGQAQFTVTLSSASSESIFVDYSTRDGSAVAGTDYVAASGQLVLAPGSLSVAIGIDLVDDGQEEGTESFAVDLQSSAQVADGEGVATITDDDAVLPPQTVSISVRVASGTDDAEETQTGQMNLTSTDLDMTTDLRGNGGSNQIVGLRFRQVSIPAGATILSAAIQFKADEAGSSPASLLFRGEAINDAPGFTSGSQNITSRAMTNASVSWQADPWPSVGASGPAQLSADLSPVIQEIVDRPGWQDGQALVIIISGSGDRIAEAYEGSRSAAPQLQVSYQSAPGAPLTKNWIHTQDESRELDLSPYPNPFNSETLVSYSVASEGRVMLRVFNMRGQLIRTLVDAVQAPGIRSIHWDGQGNQGQPLGSGMYLMELITAQQRIVRKLTMLK